MVKWAGKSKPVTQREFIKACSDAYRAEQQAKRLKDALDTQRIDHAREMLDLMNRNKALTEERDELLAQLVLKDAELALIEGNA